MHNTWKEHPILTRPDNSYIITFNEYPYHVPPDMEEFSELWDEINAFAQANPAQMMPEPTPPAPTPDEIKAVRVQELKSALDELDRKSARSMRAVIAGSATDADRASIAELEARAEVLRAELAALGG